MALLTQYNLAWVGRLLTYAASGAENKLRGVQFNVSIVGYQNIIVEWDQRFSNSASRNAQFKYSTNGTNPNSFVDFGSLLTANAGDTWFNNKTVDLSSITEVNDNPNFAFRIVSAFDASIGDYVSADSVAPITPYATTGTWRFDMVQVNATPVPEPITILGSLTAIGIGTAIKRKYASAGHK